MRTAGNHGTLQIEDTSRAGAARFTVLARPKLWITFAVGAPVTGCRSLCANCRYDTVDPFLFRRRVSRTRMPTANHQTTLKQARYIPVTCAYRHTPAPPKSTTCTDSPPDPSNAYQLRNSGQLDRLARGDQGTCTGRATTRSPRTSPPSGLAVNRLRGDPR